MMNENNINSQNTEQGAQESLRALIEAIAPQASGSNGNLAKAAVVDRLTEKLSELVGTDTAAGFQHSRNEKGEYVNEEGLPVVEISEPIDIKDSNQDRSLPPPISVEPLIPLATLPPSVQDRLREQRHRILDLLEEEERQTELAEKRKESEERDEILRKRREDASKEKDKMKAARELQKKMGRALIQNMGIAKEKEREEQEVQRLQDEEADRQRKSPSTKKKTVAFVDSLTEPGEETRDGSFTGLDWGDVTPARLQTSKRPTLMSQALLDRHPMKLNVVERVPGDQIRQPSTPRLQQGTPDSDDESTIASSSDEDEMGSEGDGEPVLEKDEVDLDFAAHQREIALEYHRKRDAIGQAATEVMMNPHEQDQSMGGVLELNNDSPKPPISQFRANHIASAYNASMPTSSTTSTTAPAILPASTARTMQRAIKTGKLDEENHLVGGEADSASEEGDGVQEVLELLRKGEVYNIGPDGNRLHIVAPKANIVDSSLSVSAPSTSISSNGNEAEAAKSLPPPSMRSKTSRFKASSAAAGRPSTSASHFDLSSEPLSPSPTPVSHDGRSSPKLNSPATMTSVMERKPLLNPSATATSSNPTRQSTSSPAFSVVIDSPSFPMHHGGQGQSAMSPTIISSPSFPPPQSSRRPNRPPTVLSSRVLESQQDDTERPTEKMSRFKAERMYP